MSKKRMIVLCAAALLLLGVLPVMAQDTPPDSVVKSVCASALGYMTLEPLKEDLLLRAKREVVNELFGEMITSATEVDDLVVTSDQIRVQALGLIRLAGSATYAQGPNLTEVCVTITAYVTVDDRLLFTAESVTKRQCITEPALTIRQVRTKAEETARIQALLDFDNRLEGYPPATILPLLRRITYTESVLLTDTDSYCVTVTGAVVPIEVLSFLSLDGELVIMADATPIPAAMTPAPPTPTLRPTTATATATPTPRRTLSPAEATATSQMATVVAFQSRTPTPLPTNTPAPDSTGTAVALMVDVFATAQAAGQTIVDLAVNPVDEAVYVFVPAGEFVMGAGDGEAHEQPVHTVVLDAFWIMRTEVTNGMYGRCVRSGVCTAPNNSVWKDVRFADHPVTDVDWTQAAGYADWAGGRLPTEAEWEKACRGGDLRPFPWGDAEPAPDLLNFGASGLGATTAADSYPAGASPYGALDMAGNVWEWTADWYDAGYYGQSPEENPQGPDSSNARVMRGGSWGSNAGMVRCAYRFGNYPVRRDGSGGFRVVSPGF